MWWYGDRAGFSHRFFISPKHLLHKRITPLILWPWNHLKFTEDRAYNVMFRTRQKNYQIPKDVNFGSCSSKTSTEIKCYINYLWHSNYWCGYYGNKVLHNTCNMCIHDLPDMNALIPWACDLGFWAYILGKSLMLMIHHNHATI